MNPYYQALKARVEAGELIILSIVSPPRTGSTVLEKSIYNAFPVLAAQLNEPSSQIHAGEDRVCAMYQSIWEEVVKLAAFAAEQGIDLQRHPLVILTKNLFYYIGQDKEWKLFDDLVAHHIVTVRHPAATFESYTKAVIETLEKQAVTLEQVIQKGCDLSHIDWDHPVKSPLRQHINYMNGSRDYASLGEGFRDAVVYRLPILATRAYQQEIWAGDRRRHRLAGQNPEQLARDAGFYSWDEMVGQYLGTPLAGLKDLPALLREPIEVLRYGWTATEINFASIQCPKERLTVIDYYDFLLDPQSYLTRIRQISSLKLSGAALGHARSAFNLGVWEGEPNEEPFFGEVKRRNEILRPCKGPVPLERLPAFLHPHIKEAFAVYLQILQSRQRLQPSFSTRKMLAMPSRNGEHSMRELDPVHAYVQVTVAQDIQPWEAKVRILAALRSSHPAFSAYFDLIDGTTTGIASTECGAAVPGKRTKRYSEPHRSLDECIRILSSSARHYSSHAERLEFDEYVN